MEIISSSSPSNFRRLPIILCVAAVLITCFSVPNTTEAVRPPGFLYTRTRGRCTPQFWSSRREAWPKMVPQTSTVWTVFGSLAFERYRSELTLLESTAGNDDENAFAGLLKQASAALLNSYARKGYPYSAWEVKTLLIQALVSEDAARNQAKQFSMANEDCN